MTGSLRYIPSVSHSMQQAAVTWAEEGGQVYICRLYTYTSQIYKNKLLFSDVCNQHPSPKFPHHFDSLKFLDKREDRENLVT